MKLLIWHGRKARESVDKPTGIPNTIKVASCSADNFSACRGSAQTKVFSDGVLNIEFGEQTQKADGLLARRAPVLTYYYLYSDLTTLKCYEGFQIFAWLLVTIMTNLQSLQYRECSKDSPL